MVAGGNTGKEVYHRRADAIFLKKISGLNFLFINKRKLVVPSVL